MNPRFSTTSASSTSSTGRVAMGGCADDGDPAAVEDRAADVIGRSIVDYCSYGAVSSAQLEGCLTHTTVNEISELGTNAARRARGCPPGTSTERCLARLRLPERRRSVLRGRAAAGSCVATVPGRWSLRRCPQRVPNHRLRGRLSATHRNSAPHRKAIRAGVASLLRSRPQVRILLGALIPALSNRRSRLPRTLGCKVRRAAQP
jgi:hypothetical protein